MAVPSIADGEAEGAVYQLRRTYNWLRRGVGWLDEHRDTDIHKNAYTRRTLDGSSRVGRGVERFELLNHQPVGLLVSGSWSYRTDADVLCLMRLDVEQSGEKD